MATAQLGTLLRHIHKLAAGGRALQRTDRQLLDDFSARRDEAAFTAVVARHGPMVLRVCRRALNHEQDAEDAFQATFLILARKTGSILKREALAEWLHGVAYRTALEVKRSAARRRNHEARLWTLMRKAAVSPTWDDVQSILDEEIRRLPEAFRTAFVLCILEGKTGPQAAAELGVKEGTVSSRLTRARQLLQQRLVRRGIKLSALLAALSVAEGVVKAALPAMLANVTVRAGLLVAAGETVAGVIPSHVAALAAGVTRTMFLTKAKIAIGVLFAMGLFAAGTGVLTRQVIAAKETAPPVEKSEPPAKEAAKPQTERAKATTNPKDEKAETVEVSGRVLDPDGKPLAGAKLYLSSLNREIEQYKHEERATSGPDGRFRLTVTREEFAQDFFPTLSATAKGYGPNWVFLDKKNMEGELSLRLVRDDVPIKGRIIDVEGRPVVGAKLRVLFVGALNGLDKYLEYVRTGGYEAGGVCGPLPGQPTEMTTDIAGRFTLTGVGSERVVRFAITGPKIQHWAFQAMTRAADTVQGPEYGTKVYGANFVSVAAASVPIRGKVRDQATGKPVAGVKINGDVFRGARTSHTTRTDKDGGYELLGYPRSETYQLVAQPAEDQPYFARKVGRPDTPGSDSITADIELVSGIPLSGQVTDAGTKKPVKGAKVYYYPLSANRFVARIGYDLSNINRGEASSTTTRADGSFSLPVLPGPGVIALACSGDHPYMSALVTPGELRHFIKDDKNFRAPDVLDEKSAVDQRVMADERYQALALVNPKEKAESVKQALTVQPGRTLTGTVIGTDGKPLAGATVEGLTPGQLAPISLATDSFTLTNVNPQRNRYLEFRYKEKGLGLFKVIRCDRAEPLSVQLQPCGSVIGRILDKDGKPVPDVPIRLYQGVSEKDIQVKDAAHSWGLWSEAHQGLFETDIRVRTDRDGRFRLDSLVAGHRYELSRGAILTLEDGKVISFPRFEIEPGKVKDLGDAKPQAP
jgi:RNA polymerase sigma factor (sigma-70 family)